MYLVSGDEGGGVCGEGEKTKKKRHLLSESGIYEKQEVPFLNKFLFLITSQTPKVYFLFCSLTKEVEAKKLRKIIAQHHKGETMSGLERGQISL